MYNTIKVFVPSLLLGLLLLINRYLFKDIDVRFLNILALVDWIILPIVAVFATILLKRKYLGKGTLLAFVFSMGPGLMVGLSFGYGWYLMGHGLPDLASYITFLVVNLGILEVLVRSSISGILGAMIDHAFE